MEAIFKGGKEAEVELIAKLYSDQIFYKSIDGYIGPTGLTYGNGH